AELPASPTRRSSDPRELAEKTQHRFTDSMTHTWKAMGWSLLRVLPAPVLLGATGFRLERLPDTDRGVDIIAAVLWVSAIWWLARSEEHRLNSSHVKI